MSHHTTHRRNLAASNPQTPMDPTPQNHHPTPPNHHRDPPTTTTTVQNISNHFTRLYLNHKARSSSKTPLDTHLQASSKTASLTKSQSQTGRGATKTGKPHYYYSVNPLKEQPFDEKQQDTIKKPIVVSKEIPIKKQEDYANLMEKNGKLEKGYEVKKQSLSLIEVGKGRRRRRSSFGSSSQAELADFFSRNGVKVVSVDMAPFMQIHAVDLTRKTYDSLEKFTAKTLALTLKKEFDGVYGPAWHCIVGSSFGSFVTHSVGGFLYFSMDQKIYVLLFKTAVQRAH